MNGQKLISQYVHDSWLGHSGLPNSGVQCLAQTPDGYLWIGTQDGLFRFDGARFIGFNRRNTETFLSNDIFVLLVARDGKLWIGTDNGLNCYYNNRFSVLTVEDGLPSSIIRALYEDNNGNLWVGGGGADGGLSCLGKNKNVVLTTADGLLHNTVYAICEDGEGNFWVGTKGGLSRRENDKFVTFTLGENSNLIVNDLFVGRSGVLWVATEADGLFCVEGGQSKHFDSQNYLPNNKVATIFEDRSGNMWFGLQDALCRLANGKFESYGVEQGWASGRVCGFHEDLEGSLWVVSIGGGLRRLREGKFLNFTTKQNLAADLVWSICQDRADNVWIGTSNGLSRYYNGELTNYTIEEGLSSNTIYSICEDLAENLWFGTDGGGLIHFRDNKFTTFSKAEGLPSETIFSICEDSNGRLWIGGRNGELSIFRGGKFTVVEPQPNSPRGAIWSICEDRQKNLWFGTLGTGLCRLANDKFTSFTVADGFSSNIIYDVYEDLEGGLWCGSNGGGLNYFCNGKVTALTVDNGLFDNVIYRILEDDQNRLWMTSNRGLFYVSKNELKAVIEGSVETVASIVFGEADGMLTSECNGGTQPAGWRTSDGKLWIPTMHGMAVIDPRRLLVNSLAPPVLIEEIVADEQTFAPARSLEFVAGTDKIEIHYTALSFIAPERMRFRYRLGGFDREWVEAGARRTAYYTNLPPGDYRFQVAACNADGIWNNIGASCEFRIAPFFYQRKLFWAACATAAAGGSFLIYKQFLNDLLKRAQAQHQAVLEERTRLAREIHDTLAQDLTGIIAQLQAAEELAAENHNEQQKRHVTQARELAKESLQDARRWVLALRSEVLEESNLCQAIKLFVEQTDARTAVNISCCEEGTLYSLPPETENNILRIAQEAVNNSIKHAEAANITVFLRYKPDELILQVTDDGRGFETDNRKRPHNNFGLTSMRERAKIIKAELEINSQLNRGTIVTATVPTV